MVSIRFLGFLACLSGSVFGTRTVAPLNLQKITRIKNQLAEFKVNISSGIPRGQSLSKDADLRRSIATEIAEVLSKATEGAVGGKISASQFMVTFTEGDQHVATVTTMVADSVDVEDLKATIRENLAAASDVSLQSGGGVGVEMVTDIGEAPFLIQTNISRREHFQTTKLGQSCLKRGVNLIDTAEQYPIPAGGRASEGDTERVIGNWMKDRNVPRIDVVIATKITGGTNITPRNIKKDCEESLKRLQTDYVDVYLCHWPQRYSPQSNWGQSLSYDLGYEASYRKSLGNPTSFEDLCQSMEGLIQAGKIRGWGLCNDNAYGLTACTRTAKALGTTPPCTMQGDFSILDRKSEENGVAEAASPYNENVGFMAYNTLAGGMLTGKYMDVPSAFDDTNRDRAMASLSKPRGRMDTRGWGGTLIRYRTEAAQDAIREYNKIAKANKMSLTELSLRWCKQRDLITTTLLGHTNMNQLKETLDILSIKEDLPPDIMWEIDRIHMKNRLPLFSNNRTGKDWYGEGEIGENIP